MNLISINGIRIFGYHGVYEEERKKGQYFIVDIKYSINNVRSDSLKDTVDYSEIIKFTISEFNANRYNLMEILVDRLSRKIKRKFNLNYIKLSLTKEYIHEIMDLNTNNIIKSIKVEVEKKD